MSSKRSLSSRSSQRASSRNQVRSSSQSGIPRSSTSLPSSSPSSSVMPSASGLLSRIDTSVDSSSSQSTSKAKRSKSRVGPDPSSTSVRNLLRHNTDRVKQARSRLEAGRQQVFYFLTVPGLLRILEVFFSVLHIGIFAFFCTHYERKVQLVLPPFFLAHIREQYFMLANYHSLMGCMCIVLCGVFSSASNTALLSSLYPLVFDFLQVLTLGSSGAALLLFYRKQVDLILEVMPVGYGYKEAITISGLVLACLHLISVIYDWIVFIKRIEIIRRERDALKRQDQETVRNAS